MTDEDLLQQFLAGNQDAFMQLMKRHKNNITNFTYRIIGTYDEAVDCAQETFVRVFRFGASFSGEVKFTTWLYTIAGNVAKTELKKKRRRNTVSISQMGNPDDDSDWDIPDTDYMPDTTIDATTVQQKVQKALMNVNPTFREVIILREIQQLSYEEIAAATQTEIGTVKSRINRGRAQLQEQLRDVYHELFK